MINKVILIGNVGADPEVRNFENGGKLARVNIASTEQIYNPSTGERRDHTEWHTLIFNRSLAGVVELYVRKGRQIYVEGKIRSREWTDAQGVKHRSIEIHVDTMRMLGGRQEGATGVSSSTTNTQPSVSSSPAMPLPAPQPSSGQSSGISHGFGTPQGSDENSFSSEEDDLPF